MLSILILLALGALSGFILGRNHLPWHAILATGAGLVPVSTVVLRVQGFGALVPGGLRPARESRQEYQ